MFVPRRKYGRLRKVVEIPSKNNCSRCRTGKYCPIEGHEGNKIIPNKDWAGPSKTSKRIKKGNK